MTRILMLRLLMIFFSMFIISTPILAMSNDGPVDVAPFYKSLPIIDQNAKLGTLIKSEKIDTQIPGASAWRIAYVSSDVADHKTLVTALLVAPIGTSSVSSRPIMAWAHGTTGTAQNCGPSQVLNPAQPLNQYFMLSGTSWTDFGIPAIDKFIKAGYVVVATDYQGLGGGGKHQYTVAATQARDVINSIRAATLLPEAGAGSKAIIYGWSQGGGATIAAAGLNDYVNAKGTAHDGIQLLGFVAMAPFDVAVTFPTHKVSEAEAAKVLQQLENSFGNNVFNFAHYAQNIWGMTAAFTQLNLQDIFTPKGADIINKILERKCMHVAADTINYLYGTNYKTLLLPKIKNTQAWMEAYIKSGVIPVKPMAPVIIFWGNKDVTVPPIMGQLYYEQMCKLGGNITRIELPGQNDHFSTPLAAEPLYVQWVADRFAGKLAPNGCNK